MTTINTCYSDYTKIIDIAALGHVLNPIEIKEEAHIVELDDIPISSLLFRRIYYAYDGDTFNLDCQGTLISSNQENYEDFVKGISSIPNISIIQIKGSLLMGYIGLSARFFNTFTDRCFYIFY